ncbi:MAG: hypothetical protein LC623_05390 [Halobacteriales archaeon]|nr:hypothetical protein [Halobacteriales archaeon]
MTAQPEGPPCPLCGVTLLEAPCVSVNGDKPGNVLPYRHAGRAPPSSQGRLPL